MNEYIMAKYRIFWLEFLVHLAVIHLAMLSKAERWCAIVVRCSVKYCSHLTRAFLPLYLMRILLIALLNDLRTEKSQYIPFAFGSFWQEDPMEGKE